MHAAGYAFAFNARRPDMFDHIGLRAKNVKAASRLYEAMLKPLLR